MPFNKLELSFYTIKRPSRNINPEGFFSCQVSLTFKRPFVLSNIKNMKSLIPTTLWSVGAGQDFLAPGSLPE